MEEKTIRVLESLPAKQMDEIACALCNQLTNKGLSLWQAEALLDYAKDLLKMAKI